MIPPGLKIIYTLFVCALVPIYWRQYGPTNFLWFSDIAEDPVVHPRAIMFSYRSAGITSLGTSPTRVRSTCFSLADNCCAGGAAVVVPAKQPTRKCELGVRFRPKSAEDYACAAVRNSVNVAVPHSLSICRHTFFSPGSFARQDDRPMTTDVVGSGEM